LNRRTAVLSRQVLASAFTPQNEASTATEVDANSDVYWYHRANGSFGFAAESSVNLAPCDTETGSGSASRLCWNLDGVLGGDRAGATLSLAASSTVRKVVYASGAVSA